MKNSYRSITVEWILYPCEQVSRQSPACLSMPGCVDRGRVRSHTCPSNTFFSAREAPSPLLKLNRHSTAADWQILQPACKNVRPVLSRQQGITSEKHHWCLFCHCRVKETFLSKALKKQHKQTLRVKITLQLANTANNM